MSEKQLRYFETRLSRIDQIHAAGGAFEANGALGRAYFDSVRPRPKRRFPWRALVLFCLTALVLKALAFGRYGAEPYEREVARLAASGAIGKGAAWVVEAGPATRFLGSALHDLMYR